MTRINLAKYGFVRWPEEDFSDDGNRFQGWKAGKGVRVSKLVAHGDAYLSISSDCGKGTLPYEIYSKLPHYNDALWKWNGVSVDSLTDQDLKDFYNACILYEMEYEDAESRIVYPTADEIRLRCKEVEALRKAEVDKIGQLISANIHRLLTTASSYKWAEIQRLYIKLVEEAIYYNPDKIRVADSIKFCSDQCKDLEPSWWYKRIEELVNE